MKSRTSFFNLTIFKKNLTRFAPAWGLYTVFLMMSLLSNAYDANWMPYRMANWSMALGSALYAMVCAMLLFGDLFQSRMCNALHALPIRRETWFATNVISGLAFQLIPTGIVGILSTVMMAVAAYPMGWVTGPLWLLCANLMYVCYFGIAVFSVMCVGSRFAMAVVYGILNFGSMIAYWLVDTLYVSQLYGIQTKMEYFQWFSPMGYFVEHPVAEVEHIYRDERYGEILDGILTLGEGWGYLWICAAAGLVMGALALVLYRRRRLESAGDFLAIRKLGPVFLVVYTLCVGAVFDLLMDNLIVGLVVGYFIGQMLLQRTVRVFNRKTFGRCALLIGALVASLAVVAWDPTGIEEWVPEKEEVEYVVVRDSHYIEYSDYQLTLEEAEEVERVLAVHEEAIEEYRSSIVSITEWTDSESVKVTITEERDLYAVSFSLEYHLKSGRVVTRYYTVNSDTQSYQILKGWFSSAEFVFGMDAGIETLLETFSTGYVKLNGDSEPSEVYFSGQDARNLLTAIMADCEAGKMAQNWGFVDDSEEALGRVIFSEGLELRINTDCENVIQWLKIRGIDTDALVKELKQE